jgi:hypothetical protein
MFLRASLVNPLPNRLFAVGLFDRHINTDTLRGDNCLNREGGLRFG